MNLNLDNPLAKCQLKFVSDSDEKSGEFEGYASVFNSDDLVNDTIAPGAFAKSLESGVNPRMFVNHDHHEVPVGSWVDLKEDDSGLFGRGQINLEHHMGATLLSAMKRGDMDGLSIGFTMEPDDFTRKEDWGRTIHNLSLKEISVVTFPCEESARICGVKADDMLLLGSIRDCEDYLRESVGLSKSVACAIVSHITKLARSESALPSFESQHVRAVSDRIRKLATA